MINQFLEKMMEQYDLMISRKNTKKSSMVLCNGQLTIGYLFWQKEEDQRKSFNVVRTLTLPNTSCISKLSRDILEVVLFILSCKTMYCYQRASLSLSTTSEM